MTNRLAEAFRVAERLSEREQDALADAIIAELQGDAGWDMRFAQTQDVLSALADEALAEVRAGTTRWLDPSKL